MSACRGCGREILWAETNHGKKVPLDPNAIVYSVMKYDSKLIAVRPTANDRGEQFYVSHFNTCSRANDFSGSRSQSPSTPEKHFSEPKE